MYSTSTFPSPFLGVFLRTRCVAVVKSTPVSTPPPPLLHRPPPPHPLSPTDYRPCGCSPDPPRSDDCLTPSGPLAPSDPLACVWVALRLRPRIDRSMDGTTDRCPQTTRTRTRTRTRVMADLRTLPGGGLAALHVAVGTHTHTNTRTRARTDACLPAYVPACLRTPKKTVFTARAKKLEYSSGETFWMQVFTAFIFRGFNIIPSSKYKIYVRDCMHVSMCVCDISTAARWRKRGVWREGFP